MIQIWCDVCVWNFTLTKKKHFNFSHMRMADSGEATEITNIVHTFFASITICSNFGTPPLVRSAILRRSKTAAWFYTKRRPVHFSYELCITKLCCLQKIPPWTQSSELPVSNIAAGRWMVIQKKKKTLSSDWTPVRWCWGRSLYQCRGVM